MDWQKLLDPQIRNFIREHQDADVPSLALKRPPSENWPWKLILDQIKARQKAKIKMPQWLDHQNVIFPPPDIIEQASSTATARYKAHLVNGKTFADLTGGAGVDCWAFAEKFESGICIERDQNAAELLAHNMSLLCKDTIAIHNTAAENFVSQMPTVDFVYIDPQRRTENKKGFYRFEDCTPNIVELLPSLTTKAKMVMIKASPMLDIWEGIKSLQFVEAVHIVEWQGECKGLIYILNPSQKMSLSDTPVTAAKINDGGDMIYHFTFTKAQEETTAPHIAMPQKFLFEPGPAFQKAGAFNALALRYDLHTLHRHTHLYTAQSIRPDFPGHIFEILSILPVDKKSLPVKKANLKLRNFPGTVEALRRKLGLEDGGEDYLFACTLADESKTLIHTRRIQRI